MIRRRALLLVFLASLFPALLPSTRGQSDPQGGIEITADELEYETDKKLLTGRGNVVVQQGADMLRADVITVRTDTQDAYAVGNVTHERDGQVWRGDRIHYNFKTQTGDFGSFQMFSDPYFITAEDSQRVSADKLILKRVRITTCDSPNPEYHIWAGEARVLHGERLVARNVVFFLGPVPVFYVPWWTRKFAGDGTDIDIVPGRSSRMGPYLLTAYNYRINDVFKATTHVDYRVKRGVAVGQDVQWGDSQLPYEGQVRGYYLRDQRPLSKRKDDEIAEQGDLVDEDRYRLKLSDRRVLSSRDTLITELNYISDPWIIEDFFRREFRYSAQPENRISLTHRGEQFTAGLQVNKRLNDFFDNVDRIPEAFFTVPRLQLWGTQFFYETENTASLLERVYPKKMGQENYDAFRVDSRHMLYYPTRHFGFLNVMPRAGYRGTYYSKTFKDTFRTNVITGMEGDDVVSVTTEVVRVRGEAGADVRSLFEIGFETSFKAFSVWHEQPLMFGTENRGLRHVVEPYARHTYIPEPNLLRESLPQFDAVDTLGKRHDVQLGVRNKLQTRRRNRIRDLLDLDAYIYYRLEKDEGQNDFSDIRFKGRLRLVDSWAADVDGAFDPYEMEFTGFNSQLAFFFKEQTRLSFEYRYQKDRRNQLAGELVLFPNRTWSFSMYERYSFEESRLEEQSYFLQYKSRCVGYGAGFRRLDKDDNQFWIQLWLLAFPKSNIDISM